MRKLKGEGIPLMGNNSLAIAAACQTPKGDEDAARRRVMWGAVGDDGLGREGVGHCCFTRWGVERLRAGVRYI